MGRSAFLAFKPMNAGARCADATGRCRSGAEGRLAYCASGSQTGPDGRTSDQAPPLRGHHRPSRPGTPPGEGGGCAACPAYQAYVFSPRDRRTIRKSFRWGL